MTWSANIPEANPTRSKNAIKRLRSTRAYIDTMRAWRARFPICQRCHVRASTQTHHVIPVHLAPELILSTTNLEAVCDACHEAIHTPPHATRKLGGPEDHAGATQKCGAQTNKFHNPFQLSNPSASTAPESPPATSQPAPPCV